ncbi:MAG: sugar-transfer associated ATP-grasp domain-containing protein [Limnochordia bacterium]
MNIRSSLPRQRARNFYIRFKEGYLQNKHHKRFRAKKKHLDPPFLLDSEQKRQIQAFYQDCGLRIKDYIFHQYYYAKTGVCNPAFIPDGLFHAFIVPHFNNLTLAQAWRDKNYFDLVFRSVRMPETLIRNINGTFLDKDYNIVSEREAGAILEREREFVIKPSMGTGGGRDVMKYTSGTDTHSVLVHHKKNFIAQRVIKQNRVLAGINDSSVNTIRITSLFLKSKVYCLAPFLRVGSEGHFADNTGVDRVLIGVDEQGILQSHGYNLREERVTRHPNGNSFAGIVIPNYDEIIGIINSLHPMLAHFGLIYWDFALDSDANPILIELNLVTPNITILQLIHGPMFGEMTSTVLREVSSAL